MRALNALWGATGRWGRVSLDVDDLLEAAVNAERLEDLGPEAWREPLEHLVAAIDAEADLHPLGRMIQRTRLVGNLRCRLRQQAVFDGHPELLDRPVKAPIVITGLQRSGTTFLHRLLAADPRIRSLRSWEAVNPAPFQQAATGAKDPRRRLAHQATRAVGFLAPDFLAVHPIEAESPEEEVVVLDQTFLSTVAESLLHVPGHAAWLESQDQRPGYRLLRKVMQLLDAAEPRERWVLKTPHHLEWLGTLSHVFPDVHVIHTHRDPVVTVGSFCSMVAHGRGLSSDRVDPRVVGDQWLRKIGRMIDRSMAFRDKRPDVPVHDVRYDDLVADPLGTVGQIYRFLGLSLPEHVQDAIDAQRVASPAHKYGRHVYELSDFGLTPTQVADRFAAYRERHDLG
ncbi:MAG: sulfotransferase [Alphaproteobacteria bacterium]|nr:sulfotransferase [Alphaproteobacteria bacterium]